MDQFRNPVVAHPGDELDLDRSRQVTRFTLRRVSGANTNGPLAQQPALFAGAPFQTRDGQAASTGLPDDTGIGIANAHGTNSVVEHRVGGEETRQRDKIAGGKGSFQTTQKLKLRDPWGLIFPTP